MAKSYESAIIAVKEPETKKSYESAMVTPGNKFGEELPPPGYLREAAEDAAVSAYQGATAQFGDEIADMVKPGAGDQVRDMQKTAQERSPVASFIGETAGEQVNPILKAGSLRKNILAGMAKVVGASEDKLSKETAIAGAANAGLEIVADVGVKALKIPFANKSSTLRARVAGAGTTEFKDVGVNDRDRIADTLYKDGFFTKAPVEFNLKTGKFEKVKKNLPIVENPTSEKLMERAQNATKVLGKEYNDILDAANVNGQVVVDPQEMVDLVEQAYEKFIGSGARRSKREAVMEPIIEDLYNDLIHLKKGQVNQDIGFFQGPMDLKKVNQWKSFLQDEASYGKDSLIKDIPDIENFYADLAHKVNELVALKIPDGKRLRELGMKQHDLLIVQRDLRHKIARQKATGLVNPPSLLQGRQGSYAVQKLIETLPMGSTDEGLLLRASAQDATQKLNETLPEVGNFVRQMVEGIPREVGKSLAPKDSGRSPQSVQNLPEHLMKMKIPRTVEGVLKHKEAILMKVAQQDPTFYPMFKEFMEERPEELGDLLPKLIASTPNHFERDRYNRVDGKVMDQPSKLRAINDTMTRTDLTNTEKIRVVNQLNKTGLFPDIPMKEQ